MPHTLRYALRSLRKSPLFAAVAIASLGLALALNTTMFALVDSVLHPYVPYREPGRLFHASIWGGDVRRDPLSADEQVRLVREGMRSQESFTTYGGWATTVAANTNVEDRFVAAVAPDFFDVIGVRPALGRALGAADAAGAQAAVISYRMWKGAFESRPLEQGLTIGLGQGTYSVVGVMPRGMHLGGDIWVPRAAAATDTTGAHWPGSVIFRLKRGATPEGAQGELRVIAQRLTTEYSTAERPYAARISPAAPQPRAVDRFYKFLVGAVATVLLVACANLATMMLARGMARRRETAVRMALGAGRAAIVRAVLVECGLLAAAGGALGVLLTVWAMYILANRATRYVWELGDLMPVPSWRVFAFALAASAVTMLLAGVIPAARASATDPAEPMKEGSGNTTGRVRDRYSPLVIFEAALSTALLMGAVLLVMQALEASAYRSHFSARNRVSANLWLTRAEAADGAAVDRFYMDLVARAQRLPGALAAATSHNGSPDGPVVVGEAGRSGEHWINLKWYSVVSPDYLRVMRVAVVQGRDFQPGDGAPGAEPVVIVDQNAARRLWVDLESPVGRLIKLGEAKSKQPWLRVVGVARSTRAASPGDDPYLAPEPDIYVVRGGDSTRQRDLWVAGTEAQTGQSPLALAVRREIQTVAPKMMYVNVSGALEHYDQQLVYRRFLASLFTAFGAFALALTGVGLYGVLAYSVSRRLREFAVRIALGARRRDVARIVLHDAAVMALAGIGTGAFVALAAAPVMSGSAYALPYTGVLALLAAEGVLLLVAFGACLGPLRRAASADPVEILRAT